jgi:hypothetical protein
MAARGDKWIGPPECEHKDRLHFAKGMCQQCYMRSYDQVRAAKRREERGGYDPNYRKPPHKPRRMAECHPDRPHQAHGLCFSCYNRQRVNSVKATCHPDRPHLANGLCATCHSNARYDQDPETARRQQRESQARMRKRNRDEMVEAYGGQCACPRCPETNPAFLTLEHINGTGKAHRAKVGSHTYADLRRRGWPQDGYTLLCWNCNAMTRYGEPCPHLRSE